MDLDTLTLRKAYRKFLKPRPTQTAKDLLGNATRDNTPTFRSLRPSTPRDTREEQITPRPNVHVAVDDGHQPPPPPPPPARAARPAVDRAHQFQDFRRPYAVPPDRAGVFMAGVQNARQDRFNRGRGI